METILLAKKDDVVWNKEELAALKEKIVDDFAELMRCSPEHRLYWMGTKRDLVELSHIVWESGRLLDERGMPLGFNDIVRRVFRILHATPPSRPSGVLDKIRRRKNIRVRPLIDRYMHLKFREAIPDPMKLDIRRGKPRQPED